MGEVECSGSGPGFVSLSPNSINNKAAMYVRQQNELFLEWHRNIIKIELSNTVFKFKNLKVKEPLQQQLCVVI